MLLTTTLHCALLTVSALRAVFCRKGDYPVSCLTKMGNEWFITDPTSRALLKIIARGRSDVKGRICAITENNKPYMFYRPPMDFWNYVFKKPIRYDSFRLKYNGTDFLVRRNVQSGWRKIALHGIGDAGEHTMHLFDEEHRWYRFPNGSQLTAYVARVPKTVAAADNHRIRVWDNGTWFLVKAQQPRVFTEMGTLIVSVRSTDGVWHSLRNPSIALRNYTLNLPKEIYDPYNFTVSDSQIYDPLITDIERRNNSSSILSENCTMREGIDNREEG